VTRRVGGARVEVHADAAQAQRDVARRVGALLRERGARGAVLALPTGATPRGVYAELVRLHREEGLSFRHATVFQLDEYWPVAPEHPGSFARELDGQLLAHVDVDRARCFRPDGAAPPERVAQACADYGQALARAGGLDLALLGLGTNGHVAFNEPGSARDSRTRRVALAESSRAGAAQAFGGIGHEPQEALTLGVADLLEAREVLLLALGAGKAGVVARALQGPVGPECPASFLRGHAAATWVLDRAAAGAIPEG
jgi:glucosamine-6-phosphate deaminase